MKIVRLTAANLKRLVAVEITPDGNLVQITGRNGAGKTSVLDAIWWALAGTRNVQARPIREGAEVAEIELDLGTLIVTRRFLSQPDGGYTTSIKVESPEGARYPSPQTVLDALVGELSFDPLAFARATPREQYDTLTGLLEVDVAALDREHAELYEQRRDVNREAKTLQGAADKAKSPTRIPDEVPVEPIKARVAEAADQDAGRRADLDRREELRRAVVAAKEDAGIRARHIGDLKEQLARLRDELAHAEASRDAAHASIAAAEVALSELPEVPDPVDVSALYAELDAAREANARRDRLTAERREHDRLATAADRKRKAAARLTRQMDDLQATKAAAIESAALPVPNLTLGDGVVILDGVPLEQASDAQQLRTSVALAMAANPELRVLRIRDGSLLDEDSLGALAEMADASDYQVWIERVDTSGTVGVVIEDGRVADDG